MTPTYTSIAKANQFLGYDGASSVSNQEIRQAELDTDLQLDAGRYHINEDTGLLLDPETLEPETREYLARAVACQIRYRRLMSLSGDDSFFHIQEYPEVSGPGFSRKGTRPKYSPEALKYLKAAGLVKTIGRVGHSGRRRYVR